MRVPEETKKSSRQPKGLSATAFGLLVIIALTAVVTVFFSVLKPWNWPIFH